jgi:hypothetical protein
MPAGGHRARSLPATPAHRFVDAGALARARAELLAEHPHPALTALRESADRCLSFVPERVLAMSTSANLFVLQNCLLELSLMARLGEEARHVDALNDLLVSLDDPALSKERLPEEIHCSFVLVGLAVALDLGAEMLADHAARTGRAAVATLAERLHAESLSKEWGQPVRRRAAWNHSIVSFSGLGAAGLAIADHPASASWVKLAIDRALLFFEHGVTAAGMTREGLAYCGFVFRNLGLFLRGARAAGRFDYLDPVQNPYLDRLARVPQWYAGEIFPHGGWMQNWGDSYWNPHHALIGWLATFPALDRQTAAAVWHETLGERGRGSFGADPSLARSSVFESALWRPDPSPRAHGEDGRGPAFYHCPDVGYVRERVPGAQCSFSFNCGEYIGAIHDQSDNNSFTLFAHGLPVALDAGAFDYPQEGNASSSYGHNAVVIDERGQLPAGHGVGVSGEIIHLQRDEDRLIVAGDASRSFNSLGYNEVRRALRWCVFVKRPNPYLLVFDDISKDDLEHDYEFLLHTPTPSAAAIEEGAARMELEFEDRHAACELIVLEHEAVSVHREAFACPGHPPFEEHTLWRLKRRAVNPEFVVLLVAGDAHGAPACTATLARSALSITVSVRLGSGQLDRIVLPRARRLGRIRPSLHRAGARSRRRLRWVRTP